MGNRLTQNSPAGQTNYGYDANNRLTSSGSTTYSYDQNGNLTNISTGTSFTYDAHNRMSQANLPGGLVVQYTSNGDGLKIRRIEGATTTRYYHDGIRPLYEAKADGSRNADLERDIFGNLLARQDAGGTRYYYHHDGLGSTVGLTDASGVVAAQRTYDAWGNRRTSSGSAVPGSYQFTGAELDPTSGLYHMGARFYDPTIGRWLSEDPVQDKQFAPATLNFYTYVEDRPTNLADPTGMSSCEGCWVELVGDDDAHFALIVGILSIPKFVDLNEEVIEYAGSCDPLGICKPGSKTLGPRRSGNQSLQYRIVGGVLFVLSGGLWVLIGFIVALDPGHSMPYFHSSLEISCSRL